MLYCIQKLQEGHTSRQRGVFNTWKYILPYTHCLSFKPKIALSDIHKQKSKPPGAQSVYIDNQH